MPFGGTEASSCNLQRARRAFFPIITFAMRSCTYDVRYACFAQRTARRARMFGAYVETVLATILAQLLERPLGACLGLVTPSLNTMRKSFAILCPRRILFVPDQPVGAEVEDAMRAAKEAAKRLQSKLAVTSHRSSLRPSKA